MASEPRCRALAKKVGQLKRDFHISPSPTDLSNGKSAEIEAKRGVYMPRTVLAPLMWINDLTSWLRRVEA